MKGALYTNAIYSRKEGRQPETDKHSCFTGDLSINATVMLYELLDFSENQFPAGLGWHDQIMKGFPQSALWSISRALGVEPQDTATLVGFPVEDVNWRARASLMSAEVSDKLFNIARAFQRLMVVLKDEEKTREWLRLAQDDLDDKIAVLLLTTASGTALVFEAIADIKPVKKVEMSVVYETEEPAEHDGESPEGDTDEDDPKEIE